MAQTVLITGANRGIGRGFAEYYAGAGWQVHACARDVAKLPLHANIVPHRLDVTSDKDIAALVATLQDADLDLVINNAGLSIKTDVQIFGKLERDAMNQMVDVNATSPILLTQALTPKIKKGGKVAFISSSMGSVSGNDNDGWAPYRASKAALNRGVRVITNDLAAQSVYTLILHPGWVQTEMGGTSAKVPVANSVAGMTQQIAALRPENAGIFIDYTGTVVPW